MVRPVAMSHVRIICARTDAQEAVRALHRSGVLHLETYEKHGEDDLDIGDPFPHSGALSDLLVTARSLMSVLRIKAQGHHHNHLHKRTGPHAPALIHDVDELVQGGFDAKTVQERKAGLQAIAIQVERFINRKAKAEEESRRLTREIADLCWFEPFYVSIESMAHARRKESHVRLIAGEVPLGKAKSIARALEQFEGSVETLSEPTGNMLKLLIIIDSDKESLALEALNPTGFSRRNLPEAEGMGGTPELELIALRAKLRREKHEMREVDHRIYELRQEWGAYLSDLEDALSRETEKAQAPLRFMQSAHVTVITGYAPTQNIPALKKTLAYATKQSAIVRDKPCERGHAIPVLLDNPPATQPFEFLLKLYALPAYAEIDPSMLLFATFPLFFGMMLGDIGYGLVTLILFLSIRRKLGTLRPLGAILIASSVMTILFGFVFGEFFGLEEIGHYAIPYVIHRSMDLPTLMIVALCVGFLHLVISLSIGFLNERKHLGTLRALCAKGGWIALLSGAGLVALASMREFTIQTTGYFIPAGVAWATIAVSLAMIAYGERVRGIVELPSIFGNLLSYLRLAALGLASASLAIVINELAGTLFAQGIGGILAGVAVLVCGHAINLALGLLGPFLHALRLHYVESFTKFFEGGGKEYRPFGGQ